MTIVYICKKIKFNAAHRLHSPKLSDEENKKIYGKCNNFYGHGHNYLLEVTLKGPVDPITGMVANLNEIKDLLESAISDRFDHKHLNQDVDDFKTRVPTAENMVIVIWEILQKNTAISGTLYKLVLHETDSNSVEYYGE